MSPSQDTINGLLQRASEDFRRAVRHVRRRQPGCRLPGQSPYGAKPDGRLLGDAYIALRWAAQGLRAGIRDADPRPTALVEAVVARLCSRLERVAGVLEQLERQPYWEDAAAGGKCSQADLQHLCDVFLGMRMPVIDCFNNLFVAYFSIRGREGGHGSAAGCVLQALSQAREALGIVSVLLTRMLLRKDGVAAEASPGALRQPGLGWEDSGLGRLFRDLRTGYARAAGRLHLAYGLIGAEKSAGASQPWPGGYGGGAASSLCSILTKVDRTVPLIEAVEDWCREASAGGGDRSEFLSLALVLVEEACRAADGQYQASFALSVDLPGGVNPQPGSAAGAFREGMLALSEASDDSGRLSRRLEKLLLEAEGEKARGRPAGSGSVPNPDDLYTWARRAAAGRRRAGRMQFARQDWGYEDEREAGWRS